MSEQMFKNKCKCFTKEQKFYVCNAFSFTNKQIFNKQKHVLQIIADILQTNANDLLMNIKVL